MKRRFLIILSMVLIATVFVGCSKKEETGKNSSLGETVLLNYADLNEYVKLGNYKKISVSLSSEEFSTYLSDEKNADVEKAGLGENAQLTENDVIKNGDTVKINFAGKMNGEAFEGGTSNDYELTLGSGTMIDGFEDGIVGHKLNENFTINLNFPDPYPNNTDLSGKPVSFDILVTSGTTTKYPEITAENVSSLGFDSLVEYNNDVQQRAIENYIFDQVINTSKVKKYPQKDIDYYVDLTKKYYEEQLKTNGGTFEDYLNYVGMTEDDFREQVSESCKPTIKNSLVVYQIAREMKISISQKDKDNYLKRTASEYNTTVNELKKQISDAEIEYGTIENKVLSKLVTMANIKD